MAAVMERPPMGSPGPSSSMSRLKLTGAALVGSPSGHSDHGGHAQRSRPPTGMSAMSSDRSWDPRCPPNPYLGPPEPPSARTGMMHSSSAPHMHSSHALQMHGHPAVASSGLHHMRKVQVRRQNGPPESLPKSLWSDTCNHLGDEQWPLNSVPLWVFTGRDRPRPGYREEVKFTLSDEKYINYACRLRSGQGDHYMGGSVGLVHSPDRTEAQPGSEGQLVMITDVTVQPNNTVIIKCIGDLRFTVQSISFPRGLAGLQRAVVEVDTKAPRLDSILQTCTTEPDMSLFARMLQACPPVLEALSRPGPFTVFVPTDKALASLGLTEPEDMLQPDQLEALLRCHIVQGKIPCEAMYSGRVLRATDGTVLQMGFTRWPRGAPTVNDTPVEHMDVMCSNGVVHSIFGLLNPEPTPSRRRM